MSRSGWPGSSTFHRKRRLRFSRTRTLIGGLLAASAFVLAHAVLGGAGAQAKPDQGSRRSVWDGVFTQEQARRGEGFYAEHCATCHGASLQGADSRALMGDRFWTSWQDTTVDRLLRHITANMPFSDDGALKGTLSAGVYADITAHILSRNEFPAGAVELTADTGAGVRIIRKEGPGELPSGSFVHVVGCLARGADKSWRVTRASAPARILDAQDANLQTPLGIREYELKFVLTSLDKFVGHRMSVRASLMGAGGVDGLNVTATQSLSQTCE